ncbi:hypothetical protein K2Z83_13300, partial [Oscillochloris sp. ZM17-4]|uniref:hypothetical protein n=1 Tax=Oscillochloris sp. ZM17-4 TaxID=2866714 RepID=UPI001C72C4F2
MQQHVLTRVIWPLFAALILLPLGFAPPAHPATAAAVEQPEASAGVLTTVPEQAGPHNTPATAQDLGTTAGIWTQQVTGKIDTSADIDYYSFTLAQPASRVQISLENLPADYDLILAAAADT